MKYEQLKKELSGLFGEELTYGDMVKILNLCRQYDHNDKFPPLENPPPPPPRETTEGKKPLPLITNKIPDGEIREDVPRKFVINKNIIDILKLTISIILAYKCLDLIEIFICKIILYV